MQLGLHYYFLLFLWTHCRVVDDDDDDDDDLLLYS